MYTFSTASLLRAEVVEAMRPVSTRCVRLDELHDAVGKRIAKMLGAPAPMVPSGAAADLTLGTAAVLTREHPDRIRRIPDLTGMKSEVIIQKTHHIPNDHMVRNCGVRLLEVYRGWERTAEGNKAALTRLRGVQAELFVPKIANQCPHVRARWDGSRYPVSPALPTASGKF